jgi:Spy/CpxP family protein refolding chaperone
VDSILTAEQKQKIREFELANMANMTFFPVSAFEALDLTDDQRQQIEAIKKEFEPDFEKSLEDYVSGRHRELGKKYHAFAERMGYTDITKYHHTIHNKLMAEDPVYKRLHNEITAHKERFGAKFKVKMYNVLTDEQWDRFQKLLDDPPEYIKAWRKKIKEAEEVAKKEGTWTPGPDSWKPGDPVPEEYRQQRNERRGRFPRGE